MKASNWIPPRIGSGAGAGIQDDLKKMKSSLDNFGLISKSRGFQRRRGFNSRITRSSGSGQGGVEIHFNSRREK